MKNVALLLTFVGLTACNGEWKPAHDRDLLAEPAGSFVVNPELKVKNLCVDVKTIPRGFDPSLKSDQQFVRTFYLAGGNRQIFMKLTTDIKEVSAEKVTSTTQISNVQGFDIDDMKLEETCEIKNDFVTCQHTGDEGAPQPTLEFADCYVQNASENGKNEAQSITYTLKNGTEIPALYENTEMKGTILCKKENEEKSMGKGTLISKRISSPEIVARPSAKSDCGAATFFYVKRVVLENGQVLEYIREETTEVPTRTEKTPEMNPDAKPDAKSEKK